ncbi:MAG: assimilatory sulfite reductase (NADPH) flavoprotein subunit [Pseudomonadota bacterium]
MSPAVPTPISEPAREQLGQLAAQWSAQQQLWASGYLAGLAAAGGAALADAPAQASQPTVSGTVLYGSQTGNSQGVAEALAASGASLGLKLRAVNMADYAPARLAKEQHLLVVVSTHGEGDPPDDAKELFDALGDGDGPSLSQLKYAVLALGDSSYAQFCQTGRDFDQRLAARGATALLPRVECDLDYETPAEAWRQEVLEQLRPEPVQAPVLHAVPDPAPVTFSRKNPFLASVEVNQKITGDDSGKDVRHLELSLEDSGIQYQPGDSLAVLADNPPELVSRVLAATGLADDAPVQLDNQTLALADALRSERELTRLTRPVLERHAAVSDAEALRLALSPDGNLRQFLFDHQVVDLLTQYPVALEPQALVDLLAPLAHRAYSIASSPAIDEASVHLTVARLTFEAFDEPHIGAASSALAELSPGDELRVFLDPNPRFRLPENPETPIIMIGPGTGVAPFRAFLQEREQQRDRLGKVGDNWLFFGDRHFETDFLYQIEWLRWRKSGLLSRLSAAFSRDQAEKRYVQHLMEEQGETFFAWLEAGACVYVCGDAEHMAPDVDAALTRLVQTHGALSGEQTAAYMAELKRSGRYRRDVY